MCYFTSFINKGIKTHIIWIMKSKLLQVWNTKLRKIKQGCNRSIRQSIYHSERKQEKKNQSQIKYKKLDQNAKIRAVEHVKILAYNINIENQQSVLVNMFYIITGILGWSHTTTYGCIWFTRLHHYVLEFLILRKIWFQASQCPT